MKNFLPFLLVCLTVFLANETVGLTVGETDDEVIQFDKEGDGKTLKAFAFPNPLSINSIITYELQRDSKVILSIFDCQGRLIKQLLDERQLAGSQRYFLERNDLAAGLYFLNIKAEDQVVSISIAVVD